MTMAEYLRQEGWKEGWKEGWQKGRQEIQELAAKRMLSDGLDLAYVARLTSLSIDQVKTLQDQDNHQNVLT